MNVCLFVKLFVSFNEYLATGNIWLTKFATNSQLDSEWADICGRCMTMLTIFIVVNVQTVANRKQVKLVSAVCGYLCWITMSLRRCE